MGARDIDDHRQETRRIDGVVFRVGDAARSDCEIVACEEPLEIRLAGFQLAVTMRTPGADLDLVAGFLITEGILGSLAEVETIAHCPDGDGALDLNVVNVNLRDAASFDPIRFQRNFYASSSCGICGKASIDTVRLQAPPLDPVEPIDIEVLYRLQRELRERQPVFDETGGLHAAWVASRAGDLMVVREDIGRHNAVDKAIGHMGRTATGDLSTTVLIVSGRASFEVVQKALMAGIPAVAAISAPSSLAIELAREAGMQLVGFLRDGRCNIYSPVNDAGT